MRNFFARQVAQAKGETGELDLEKLGELVVGAYEDADRDRRRTDRSMALIIDELGEVHQRLVDAFETIPEGIALFDANDCLVMWNRRYAEIYAINADALVVGARFEDVLRAGIPKRQDSNAFGREEEWVAERLARHRLPASTHEQRLQGDRWIRVEERRTASGGSVGVRIDITDLKKREESFRLMFDNNPVPMWVVDPENHKFLAVNNAAVEHYGYSREQFLALTIFDVRPAEDREEFEQYIRGKYVSQGEKIWRHLKADGSQIFVRAYARALDYQDRKARVNAIVDVTAQKLASDELSKQRLVTETAIDNMSIGLLMFDRDARLILSNRRYFEIYGVSSEKAVSGCSLREMVDERKRLGVFTGDPEKYCEEIIASIQQGKTTRRVVDLPDGRSLVLTSRPMSGGGWVSTHDDVTEQKQIGARIAKEANENRRLFETSLDLILVTDEKGNFVRVSPSSSTILGYSPEEMIGRSAAEFVYAEDLEATRSEMRQSRNGLTMRNFETRYVHKNGQIATLAWSGVWSGPERQYYFTGRDVTESKLAMEKLRHLAHYDQLTGLPNRTSLQNELRELLNPSTGAKARPTSIAMFDLDGFKDINDTLGHSTGDRLLKEVAHRMSEFATGDMRFCRLGGDEFVLTVPDCGDPREIGQAVDFILKRLRESFDIDGHQLFIGASAGIAITSDGIDAEELILNADLALYDAKAAGGNTYRLFLPVLRAKAMARRELDIELRRACAYEEFVLYYQPQLRVSDGAVVGAEALLRWRHPERGILAPGAFIEALSQSPVALEVGRWITQTACESAAKWRAMGLSAVRIGVNLFPVQFHDEILVKDVEAALLQSGLPPELLELEITENIALGNDDLLIAQLSELRSKGIHIAFDDFGTGYASLSYLARYPLTRIKIDQSFIRNITGKSKPQEMAIVRSLIAMAHNLNLQVIAEGVESDLQAAFLKAENCEEVQGYLYAKPMPTQEFEAFLRRNQPRSGDAEKLLNAFAG